MSETAANPMREAIQEAIYRQLGDPVHEGDA